MTSAMNFEQARFNMVEQQIRPWELLDLEALDLFMTVKRELFVSAAHQALSFADTQLPLGHGATMLAPKFEARALQAVAVKANDRVLEVGTGSGFMAALLAARADHVWSVERVPELAATARANLARAGVSNVTVEQGDGLAGLPALAPFDVIVVSGAVTEIPQALLTQLTVGGRLFAFVAMATTSQAQVVTRTGEASWATASVFEADVELLQTSEKSTFVF